MAYMVKIGCREVSSFHNFLTENHRLDILEPIPRNIENIKRVYGGWSNVTIHPVAVWKYSGKIRMYNLGILSYVEGVESPATSGFGYIPKESDLIEVDAITFDQFDDGTIDMLDLDMEGSEWFAIQKMISRPRVIVIETGNHDHPNMIEINSWMQENSYAEFGHQDGNSFYKRTC